MSLNPVLLQKQLRENASDLQDFAKDLKNWGEEMKRKEETLKDNGEKRKERKPVCSVTIDESKKVNKLKKPTSKNGLTDYAAWEKFDVDAELEKLEDDVNDDSELTDECNENMYDEALVEKEKGNKFVKNQNWDDAIKCYTKAIKCYSYDPIFYANRALCYLKKHMFAEAEKDCSLSIKLDNTYVKAYQRRAAARVSLNKLDYAEQDYRKVLELEPKNKESKKELEILKVKLDRKVEMLPEQRPVSKFTASRNKSTNSNKSLMTQLFESQKVENRISPSPKVIDDSKPVSPWLSQDDIIIVKPINKQPHLRSPKPLRRIEIVEISNSKKLETVESNVPVKMHVVENVKSAEEASPKIISTFKKQQIKNLKEPVHITALPRPNEPSSINCDNFKIIENENPKDEKNTLNINLTHNRKHPEYESLNKRWISPKNSVQFYSTWNNLKLTEEKYSYLKSIEPQELPKIFLNSLESQIFSSIVEILARHFIENKDPVYGFLNYLTQVKRFNAIKMFMADSDKSNLWKLFDYVKETEEISKEDVDNLIQCYEI